MKTEKNDLKLRLRLHIILKMKTTSNEKLQRIKVVVFELGKIRGLFQLNRSYGTLDMAKLVNTRQIL